MRRLFLLIIWFSGCISNGFGQIPFAQANQLPLLFNPSNAGAKDKKRIALGWNNFNGKQGNETNYTASYDQFWKKLGTGIGGYYLHHSRNNDRKVAQWDNLSTILPTKFLKESRLHIIGLCIAPKYKIMSKYNSNQIQYTLSPSFFLEYQYEITKRNRQLNTQEFHSTFYSINHPNGLPLPIDSSISTFHRHQVKSHKFRTGFGIQLNSKNAIALFRTLFESDIALEKVDQVYFHSRGDFKVLNSTNVPQRLYAIEHNLTLGISFPKKPNTRFSFAPLVGIGMKNYLNLAKSRNLKLDSMYSENYNNKQATEISYAHSSFNFRYQKILFGAAITQSYSHNYYGATIGVQNAWMKLMTNWSFGSFNYFETTINILI